MRDTAFAFMAAWFGFVMAVAWSLHRSAGVKVSLGRALWLLSLWSIELRQSDTGGVRDALRTHRGLVMVAGLAWFAVFMTVVRYGQA